MATTYTVTEYDSEDIRKLKDMSNSEVVKVLEQIERGCLPQTYVYGDPENGETYTEDQYENTRLHRGIQKAIELVNLHKERLFQNKLDKDSKPELIGQIVDVFEDWLAEWEIILENKERAAAIEEEEMDPEEIAIIYGKHYDMLGDMVSEQIEKYDLMTTPFRDETTAWTSAQNIIDTFVDVLEDGNQRSSLEAKDHVRIQKAIVQIFIKWGLAKG